LRHSWDRAVLRRRGHGLQPARGGPRTLISNSTTRTIVRFTGRDNNYFRNTELKALQAWLIAIMSVISKIADHLPTLRQN
jgi:hypothetical protein